MQLTLDTITAPAPIVDFGEKITGARKDVWATYSRTMGEELPAQYASITLSKHFPEPDYETAIKNGADADNLAAIKALRDMIPAKPRRAWKLERWGKLVTMAHGIAQKMVVEGFNIPADRLDALIAAAGGEVARRVSLYRQLGYPLFTKADGWEIHTGEFYDHGTVKLGEYDTGNFGGRAPVKRCAYAVNGCRIFFRNENQDTAAGRAEVFAQVKARIAETLSAPAADRQTEFSIYSERRAGEFFIGKKAARGVVRIKCGFKTAADTRAFLTSNRAEIEQTWEQMKAAPQLRKAANLPRLGPDRRAGNVSPEMFSAVFGFRGVQFGNYVEADRRQSDLNEAHDALIDMAQALNLPPRALSLVGALGMAFGARGTGGFKAHYEPGQIVINITKTHGPGSLAHEWFHALDNHLARLDAGSTASTGKFITADIATADHIAPAVLEAFKHIRRVLSSGGFADRSDNLDRCRAKAYYGTTIEKAARAFEIYVSDALEAVQIYNDYLANVYKGAEASAEWAECAYPYPREMEQDGIRAAYAAAFAAIKLS